MLACGGMGVEREELKWAHQHVAQSHCIRGESWQLAKKRKKSDGIN